MLCGFRSRSDVLRSVATVSSSSENVSFAIQQYYHTAIPQAARVSVCGSVVPAARGMEIHLEQVDQRAAPREDAVTFEQRLALDDFELQVLRERVDEVLVRHRRREPLVRSHSFDGGGEHGLEPLALTPQRLRLLHGNRLGDRLDLAYAIPAAAILRGDPR